jgi:hypothetical protein
MQRVYTMDVYPYQKPVAERRWGVQVGPEELFRETAPPWQDRHGSALTRWGAKREGRRIIRKNERELERRNTKPEREEVVVSD